MKSTDETSEAYFGLSNTYAYSRHRIDPYPGKKNIDNFMDRGITALIVLMTLLIWLVSLEA